MIDQIEPKSNMISLAISDSDKQKLAAISNDFTTSYVIRHLIQKSFAEGFKMPENNVIELTKEQRKLVNRYEALLLDKKTT